jgi:hypothetical protein
LKEENNRNGEKGRRITTTKLWFDGTNRHGQGNTKKFTAKSKKSKKEGKGED